KNKARRIAIAYDARESSFAFCNLLLRGFNESGLDVVVIGLVPTPVLYHTVFTKPVDGGVVITGSHNPPDHNGFKICLGKQTLFGEQIQEIKRIALSGNFESGKGAVESINVIDDYCLDIGSKVSLGGRRLKVVIDAGNG